METHIPFSPIILVIVHFFAGIKSHYQALPLIALLPNLNSCKIISFKATYWLRGDKLIYTKIK